MDELFLSSTPSSPSSLEHYIYSLISMRLIYYFDTCAIIWHGIFPVFQDLHIFARNLQHLSAKLFLLLFLKQNCAETIHNKNNFALICCKFLANLQKSWNSMMSRLNYRKYGSVSYSFTCMTAEFLKIRILISKANDYTFIIIFFSLRKSGFKFNFSTGLFCNCSIKDIIRRFEFFVALAFRQTGVQKYTRVQRRSYQL